MILGAVACGLTADFSNLQAGHRADAGKDVDVGNDAGAGLCVSPWGGGAPKLCADFDRVPSEVDGWSSKEVANGSTSLSPNAFSLPQSLESGIDAGATASARLRLESPSTLARVHAEFRVQVAPVDGDYELFAFHQDTKNGETFVTNGVFYKQRDRALQIEVRGGDECPTPNVCWKPIAPVVDQRWIKVEIDFEVAAAATLIVKHDGKEALRWPNRKTDVASPLSTYFMLGLYSYSPPSAAKAYFDDVVIDWQ